MSDINAHLGLILGILFTMIGTSYSTVKAVKFIDMGILKFIPTIMSGILAIYGLVIIVISVTKLNDVDPNVILSAGLIMGISNMFSGITMGCICDKTDDYNNGLVVALLFAESFALYGLFVSALLLS